MDLFIDDDILHTLNGPAPIPAAETSQSPISMTFRAGPQNNFESWAKQVVLADKNDNHAEFFSDAGLVKEFKQSGIKFRIGWDMFNEVSKEAADRKTHNQDSEFIFVLIDLDFLHETRE